MKESRNRRLAAGLVVAGVIGVLAVVEGAARVITARASNPDLQMTVAHYGSFSERAAANRFEPDPDLGYRLKPGFEAGATRHNRQGYRAAADFAAKPPGALRIVCLGGSTTYGVSVDDNADTYPARLEALLRERAALGAAIEVFNMGVGGYTSREVLGVLARDALPLQPDAVLVQLAINDVAPRFFPGFQCDYSHFRVPMQPLREGTPHRLLHRSHAALIAGWALGVYRPLTLQARTQRPLPPVDAALAGMAANGTDCFEENIRRIVSQCVDAGIAIYLVTQPYLVRPAPPGTDPEALRMEELYQQGQREHNTVLMAVAASTAAELIDLNRLTPRDSALFSDPIHMTKAGNRVKAELVAAALPY